MDAVLGGERERCLENFIYNFYFYFYFYFFALLHTMQRGY